LNVILQLDEILALRRKGIAELMKKALIIRHHYHWRGMEVTLSITDSEQPQVSDAVRSFRC